MGRGSKKPSKAKSSGKTSFKRKVHNKYLNRNIPCEEIKVSSSHVMVNLEKLGF